VGKPYFLIITNASNSEYEYDIVSDESGYLKFASTDNLQSLDLWIIDKCPVSGLSASAVKACLGL